MRPLAAPLAQIATALVAVLLASGCAPTVAAPPRTPDAPAQAQRPAPPPAKRLAAAVADLDRSRYAKAEAELRALLDGPEGASAALALGRLLLLTGRYAEAAELGRELAERGASVSAPRSAELRARALRAQGQLDEAIALLQAAVTPAGGAAAGAEDADPEGAAPVAGAPGADHSLRRARVLLGELLLERGDRAAAEAPLMSLIEDYNADRIGEEDGPDLTLVGRAAQLLRSARDANDAYNAAERASSNDAELLLYRAELYLDKYDPGHAEEVLQELLERAPNQPDALVAMAHVKLAQTYDFAAADELARAALAINPRHTEARFVRAGIALRDMELGRADSELDQGLAVNPRDLRLLSLKAAVRFLADDADGFAAAEQRVLSLNPQYSTLYQIVGEYAEWEHRYDEIVGLMRRALLIDSRDAKARADLGINLLRAGQDAEGVRALAAAFDEDPFNVRVYNTLHLYEQTIPKGYTTVEHGPFRIRYANEQRELLERYVPPLLDEAWRGMVKRYEFTPETPISVELYPDREQFSIRTSGLPNTGIQGVCFGRSIAAMSPGRETFNLGMTLWHELSHVFHIQRSRRHVPRWFTEGLAEWETLTARPGWRRELDPELYDALRLGRLPEVGDMNRAFTRAEDMEDMATAYYASTRIVVMLVRTYGFARLDEMLRLWGDGKRTPEVVKAALGRTPEELDADFRRAAEQELARFRTQFVPLRRSGDPDHARAAAEAAPGDVAAQCRYALALLRAGDEEGAAAALAKARTLSDQEPDVLWLEGELARAQDDASGAARAVRALLAAGHDGYDVEMRVASLAERRGDRAATRAALERARAFDPMAAEPAAGLADLAREAGDPAAEIEALAALATIEEHDAAAHRRLIRLLLDAGRNDEAVAAGRDALMVDVTGLATHQLYGEALARVGRPREARFELESALLCGGRPNEVADVHAALAQIQLTLGERARARQSAAKARELDPANPRLRELSL